eukprot:2858487-Prymnesium_polylepis.2
MRHRQNSASPGQEGRPNPSQQREHNVHGRVLQQVPEGEGFVRGGGHIVQYDKREVERHHNTLANVKEPAKC